MHAVFGVHGWELFVRLVTIVFVGTSIVNMLPPSIYPRRSTRGGWLAAIAVVSAIAISGWGTSAYLHMRAVAHPHANKLLITPVSVPILHPQRAEPGLSANVPIFGCLRSPLDGTVRSYQVWCRLRRG